MNTKISYLYRDADNYKMHNLSLIHISEPTRH